MTVKVCTQRRNLGRNDTNHEWNIYLSQFAYSPYAILVNLRAHITAEQQQPFTYLFTLRRLVDLRAHEYETSYRYLSLRRPPSGSSSPNMPHSTMRPLSVPSTTVRSPHPDSHPHMIHPLHAPQLAHLFTQGSAAPAPPVRVRVRVRESPTQLGFHLFCRSFLLAPLFEVNGCLNISDLDICALQRVIPSDASSLHTQVNHRHVFRRGLEAAA